VIDAEDHFFLDYVALIPIYGCSRGTDANWFVIQVMLGFGIAALHVNSSDVPANRYAHQSFRREGD